MTPRPLLLKWLPALAGLLVFMLYASTAAPCAWWGDGMELTCAAWTLGIAHPTGYPLYTVLGFLWTHALRWLDPGQAMTLFSLLCMVLSTTIFVSLFRHVIKQPEKQENGKSWMTPCWILVAALMLGVARTAWEHATFTEVYPLTFLLSAVFVWLCWRYDDAPLAPSRAAALGVVAGLMGLNHYSGAAFGPLALLCLFAGSRRFSRPLLPITAFFGSFFITLSGYLYLLFRSRVNPPLNWGDPSNFRRLMWVLTGGQFGSMNVKDSSSQILEGLARWLDWWGSQWLFKPAAIGIEFQHAWLGIIPLSLALAGLFILARRRLGLGLGMIAVILFTAIFAALYHIPDIEAYFLPNLIAAGVGWMILGKTIATHIKSRLNPAIPLVVAAVAIAFFALANYPFVNKHGDVAPLLWGEECLDHLPQGAMVLTDGDFGIFALWYQQIVLGKRPDVTVFGVNFIFSGWYARYFDRPGRPRHPMKIEEREVNFNKLTFDLALIGGTVLPNLRLGVPIYTTYRDLLPNPPLMDHYFQPAFVAPLVTSPYLTWFRDRFPNLILWPALFRLQPNPQLMAMDDTALKWELNNYYFQHPPSYSTVDELP